MVPGLSLRMLLPNLGLFQRGFPIQEECDGRGCGVRGGDIHQETAIGRDIILHFGEVVVAAAPKPRWERATGAPGSSASPFTTMGAAISFPSGAT